MASSLGLLPLPPSILASTLLALQTERDILDSVLPLAPSEPPTVSLLATASGIGSVDEPSCPLARSLSILCVQLRVHAGHAAAFIMRAPPSKGPCGELHPAVFEAMAAVTRISAGVQDPSDTCPSRVSPAAVMPVIIEPSVADGGILISIPDTAADGSRIVIQRASVAGCDLTLGEVPPHVNVGFNHAPATGMAVIELARSGDIPALIQLFNGGASTEEKNEVRSKEKSRSR
jgi:hypothetical protein